MIREQIAKELWGIYSEDEPEIGEDFYEQADSILSLLCAEIEKMGLTQNGNPYYFVEAGSYRPQGLQVYSDREIKLMREAFNVGRTAQLQKILNKLKEGAE